MLFFHWKHRQICVNRWTLLHTRNFVVHSFISSIDSASMPDSSSFERFYTELNLLSCIQIDSFSSSKRLDKIVRISVNNDRWVNECGRWGRRSSYSSILFWLCLFHSEIRHVGSTRFDFQRQTDSIVSAFFDWSIRMCVIECGISWDVQGKPFPFIAFSFPFRTDGVREDGCQNLQQSTEPLDLIALYQS